MYYVPICIPYQSVHPWAFSITPLSLVILGFLSQILRPKPHHDDFTVRDTAGPAYQCSPSSSHSRPNVEGQRLGDQTCSTASASVHFATIPYSEYIGNAASSFAVATSQRRHGQIRHVPRHLSTPKPHFGDPHALRLAVCFLTTSKASHLVGLTRLIDTRFRYNRELFQPSIRQCLNSTIATCGHGEEIPSYDLQTRCQLICVP